MSLYEYRNENDENTPIINIKIHKKLINNQGSCTGQYLLQRRPHTLNMHKSKHFWYRNFFILSFGIKPESFNKRALIEFRNLQRTCRWGRHKSYRGGKLSNGVTIEPALRPHTWLRLQTPVSSVDPSVYTIYINILSAFYFV